MGEKWGLREVVSPQHVFPGAVAVTLLFHRLYAESALTVSSDSVYSLNHLLLLLDALWKELSPSTLDILIKHEGAKGDKL